jgi:hypothetical protein
VVFSAFFLGGVGRVTFSQENYRRAVLSTIDILKAFGFKFPILHMFEFILD